MGRFKKLDADRTLETPGIDHYFIVECIFSPFRIYFSLYAHSNSSDFLPVIIRHYKTGLFVWGALAFSSYYYYYYGRRSCWPEIVSRTIVRVGVCRPWTDEYLELPTRREWILKPIHDDFRRFAARWKRERKRNSHVRVSLLYNIILRL